MNEQQGFTLIELMIALVLGAFVMAGVYSFYIGQFKSNIAQENILEIQQNLRSVIYAMAQDIRLAGLDPDGSQSPGFSAAAQTDMTFSYVADTDGIDNDGDNTIDEENELANIRYFQVAGSDGEYDLCRESAGSTEIIAENIEKLEFYYQLADGTEKLNPDTSTELTSIRKVQISALARASDAETGIASADSYTSASGSVWSNLEDGYRRRYLSVSVCCRNLGIGV